MENKNITKKEKAIEIMKKMDIYNPYIKGFKENDRVCFFERFGGYWVDQENELYAKMKEIEKEQSALDAEVKSYSDSKKRRFDGVIPVSFETSEIDNFMSSCSISSSMLFMDAL